MRGAVDELESLRRASEQLSEDDRSLARHGTGVKRTNASFTERS